MLCTIIDIRGDYAYVKYDDTGVVSEVAIALLPLGVDVGDRLKFENYDFTTIYKVAALLQPLFIIHLQDGYMLCKNTLRFPGPDI